jgi:lipid A ethanolaminephosphotransferase
VSKLKLSPWQLSLAAAIFVVAVNNGGLFTSLAGELDLLSRDGIGFLLTITGLAIVVLTTLFLVFGIGRFQKPFIATVFVAAAVFGYFCNEMGVIFHEEMFLNIAETVRDRNLAEATELASLPFIGHVILFGILPSVVLVFVQLKRRPVLREIGVRALVGIIAVAVLAGIALPNYRYVTYFAVEHRDLRFKVIPIFPLMSLVRLTRDKLQRDVPFRTIDADAQQRWVSGKRAIGIMVVGETARADHFSLNGYAKLTNPMLAKADVLFGHGASCGTSTLFSVPCMFSMRGRDTYDPDSAASESNVLDILSASGVRTVWIENNSSCKHVCDRIETVDLRRDPDQSSMYYSDMGYFDEILLREIDTYLGSEGPDLLIVLHTLGSHGPAYSRRYPPQFGTFSPYCENASPKECSNDLVSNAYDNTIVYTDYILDQLIEKLKTRADEFDGFLFYASDHGESLGENGVYLHGLPYALAPQAQTDVPFIAWLSRDLQRNHQMGADAIAEFGLQPLSHDAISHTLLGLFDVNAASYKPELDLFSGPLRSLAALDTAPSGAGMD